MYMNRAKKPKFYKFKNKQDVGGISEADSKIFLLRFHDENSDSVKNAGSFKEEEEAISELNRYLRMGVCSWIVRYNDN